MPPLYKNDYYATKVILFSHSTKFLTSFNFEMVRSSTNPLFLNLLKIWCADRFGGQFLVYSFLP